MRKQDAYHVTFAQGNQGFLIPAFPGLKTADCNYTKKFNQYQNIDWRYSFTKQLKPVLKEIPYNTQNTACNSDKLLHFLEYIVPF